jgi:uric acid transporter
VAVSLGIGLLPTVSPTIYSGFPTWFQIIFNSGISAGAVTAIVLNLLLNPDSPASPGSEHPTRSEEGDLSAYDAVRSPALSPTPPTNVRSSAGH